MNLTGRKIFEGKIKGEVLYSTEPISFYGGVNPENGNIIEKNHPLEGKSISGKILVFPYGKGSTVGSYTIYQLKKNNKAPKAMIMKETEAIVAVGAIISEIPCIDKIEIEKLKDLKELEVNANEAEIKF
ncbi:MAG: DUF126 domain-containing protein [Candidatus Diapherotrites archaeon]|nr:DUF126 domain-containing protein [Candidatus Diapherotrites archaeon]